MHPSRTTLAAWPVQAPLTDEQSKADVDNALLPALLGLTLADRGGWNLFAPPTLASMYTATRAVLRTLPRCPAQ